MQERSGIVLYLPLDLKMLLQEECAKNKQLSATRVLWILNEHFKDKLPKEVYENLKASYEMTAFEQREKKQQKGESRKQKGNVKLNNQLMQIRENLALCDLRLNDPTTNNPKFWEGRKKSLEEKKGILEALLKEDSAPNEPVLHKTGTIPKRKKRR